MYMKKTSIQELADNLNISRVSVWKALNGKPGVSETLRKEILDRAAEAGYINDAKNGDSIEKSFAPSHTIAVVVSRMESSGFWMSIVNQISKELSRIGLNLMFVSLPSYYTQGDGLPAVLSDGSISGIIVLNIYSEPQIKMLAALPLSKVFLDTVTGMPYESLGGDVVMIEGRAAVRQITGRLLDKGRLRLGFIGDVNYAQTNMDRYLGFLDAYEQRGIIRDESLSLTGSLHLTTHYEQISGFLGSIGEMPDGFICASDYIASFVQQYFTEFGIDQSQICITGFDNSAEYTNVAKKITTVDVQTKAIGARLANKILFAINHPDVYPEVCYVTTKVLYR